VLGSRGYLIWNSWDSKAYIGRGEKKGYRVEQKGGGLVGEEGEERKGETGVGHGGGGWGSVWAVGGRMVGCWRWGNEGCRFKRDRV